MSRCNPHGEAELPGAVLQFLLQLQLTAMPAASEGKHTPSGSILHLLHVSLPTPPTIPLRKADPRRSSVLEPKPLTISPAPPIVSLPTPTSSLN